MPELPEVETVMRGLAPFLEQRRVTNVEQMRPDLRWPIPKRLKQTLVGLRVLRLERRAKYILWHFENQVILLMHLGMSGRVLISEERPQNLDKHDHLVFTTEDGCTIRYNDPRRFGFVDLVTKDKLLGHKLIRLLGPEPIGNDFDAVVLGQRLKGRSSPIKTTLLNQTIVAGLGNIYACEALHRSGISPRRLASNTRGQKLEQLVLAIRGVLRDAIEAGGATLRDHSQVSGEKGYFQHQFQVYGRDGKKCNKENCDGKIKRIVQSGRSTFYCNACQH